MTTKTQPIKGKIDELNIIKFQNFYSEIPNKYNEKTGFRIGKNVKFTYLTKD